jgi:hypothetical protein
METINQFSFRNANKENEMFDYALKNITKRWIRSLLTILGVTVMLTLVIVITGIVSYQTRTMHAHASAGAGKINVQPLLAGESYPAEGIDMSWRQPAIISNHSFPPRCFSLFWKHHFTPTNRLMPS